MVDIPAIEQMLNLESEDDAKVFKEQFLNVIDNQNLAEIVDAPAIEQMFGSWDELDRFISFYAKLQNFVSVIRGSKYKDRKEHKATR
ncbi:6839_t:CDS:2 [Scutellospora calospora]|uniref:6839_t:CDS:1 n=1 Tax=Scutellospora calospora TaxID=85575 RepID=A0ACA9KYR3_9GLOM|nr:6839_t:CDS:2 [Scutellospora calospora]